MAAVALLGVVAYRFTPATVFPPGIPRAVLIVNGAAVCMLAVWLGLLWLIIREDYVIVPAIWSWKPVQR